MPPILGLVMNAMRPDLMEPMMNDLFGYVMVGVIAIMEMLGIFIIRRIVNIDI